MKNLFFRYGIQMTLILACITLLSVQYRRDSALLADFISVNFLTEEPSASNGQNPPKNLHLKPIFGVPPAPKEIQKEQTQKLPETRLELKLKGTFTNSNQQNASAIIAAPNGESRLFFVGDPIVEGTALARVETGAIVLRRNGQYEILRLPSMGLQESKTNSFFVSKAPTENSTLRSSDIPEIKDFQVPDLVDVQMPLEVPLIASATPAPIAAEAGSPREFITNSGRPPTESLRSRLAQLRSRQSLN